MICHGFHKYYASRDQQAACFTYPQLLLLLLFSGIVSPEFKSIQCKKVIPSSFRSPQHGMSDLFYNTSVGPCTRVWGISDILIWSRKEEYGIGVAEKVLLQIDIFVWQVLCAVIFGWLNTQKAVKLILECHLYEWTRSRPESLKN